MLRSREVVKSLFNQPSTSDLTLIVNGSQYYAHKAVVAQCSDMVATMLRSDLIERRDGHTILRINPPPIRLPGFTECDRHERELDGDSLFERYLMIIYGLQNPAALTVKELCSVAVLSNFMLSFKLAHVCEKIIVQKFWLSQDSWQEAFQFANRHGFAILTRCILDYAATIVHQSDRIEDLLGLESADILQILRLMRLSARDQFRLVICFLAFQSNRNADVIDQFDRCWEARSDSEEIAIEGDDRIDFLKQSTKLMASSWNDRDLLCRIKSVADCIVLRTNTGDVVADNFLYGAILDRLMILMRQSAEASNMQTGISTRIHKESHRNTIM